MLRFIDGQSSGASRNALPKRNHLGRDCSLLTTASTCRAHRTSFDSDFWICKMFPDMVRTRLSQKWAIHTWSSCLVQLLVNGYGELGHKSQVPEITCSQSLKSRTNDPHLLCLSRPCLHPRPSLLSWDLSNPQWNLTPLTYFNPLSSSLLQKVWAMDQYRWHHLGTVIKAESQVPPHRDWIQIYSLTRSPGNVCTHSSWRNSALPHMF